MCVSIEQFEWSPLPLRERDRVRGKYPDSISFIKSETVTPHPCLPPQGGKEKTNRPHPGARTRYWRCQPFAGSAPLHSLPPRIAPRTPCRECPPPAAQGREQKLSRRQRQKVPAPACGGRTGWGRGSDESRIAVNCLKQVRHRRRPRVLDHSRQTTQLEEPCSVLLSVMPCGISF